MKSHYNTDGDAGFALTYSESHLKWSVLPSFTSNIFASNEITEYYVAFKTNDWAPPDRMTGQWEVQARQDDRGGEEQKEKFLRKRKRTAGCSGLLIRELTVPAWVAHGQPAVLTCKYDSEGSVLYSVKWYHNNKEFYRYLKDETPNIRTFPQKGVHVDTAHSNDTNLRLINVSRETAGEFVCEVSMDAPTFDVAMASAHLNIAVLPAKPPRITGLEDAYVPGQIIAANCTVGAAQPRASLRWFLNGMEVAAQYVEPAPASPSVPPSASWSVLRLPVTAALFNGDRNAELRCASVVGGLAHDSVAFTAMLRDLRAAGNQRLAQHSGAAPAGPCPAALCTAAALGVVLTLASLRQ
ncbi:Cell adhesion molecule 2 [Frankliniella fusca]|uniref:Cell adhesion molecule 2 n=1 Tax=Frankliniella fusca TaxID=407009 RepID=A0AAE1LS30_9NEOP|nr:Cell adhesion molecule 2 [Frankliniella fusca]